MPGILVIVARPPKIPERRYFFVSKKYKETKIRKTKRLSGAPIDLVIKKRGKKRRIVVRRTGFFVNLRLTTKK